MGEQEKIDAKSPTENVEEPRIPFVRFPESKIAKFLRIWISSLDFWAYELHPI